MRDVTKIRLHNTEFDKKINAPFFVSYWPNNQSKEKEV